MVCIEQEGVWRYLYMSSFRHVTRGNDFKIFTLWIRYGFVNVTTNIIDRRIEELYIFVYKFLWLKMCEACELWGTSYHNHCVIQAYDLRWSHTQNFFGCRYFFKNKIWKINKTIYRLIFVNKIKVWIGNWRIYELCIKSQNQI